MDIFNDILSGQRGGTMSSYFVVTAETVQTLAHNFLKRAKDNPTKGAYDDIMPNFAQVRLDRAQKFADNLVQFACNCTSVHLSFEDFDRLLNKNE